MEKACKDCELCITYKGRTRCGLGMHGYKYIDKNDPVCEYYEPFESMEEES